MNDFQIIDENLIVVNRPLCWKIDKNNMMMIGERYQCPNQCGRSYKALHGVRQHLRYECGVKPKFSCTLCLKCFAYKNVLKVHMATVHTIL